MTIPGADYGELDTGGVTVFLWGSPGCLDGETTTLLYSRGKRSGCREISLRELYLKFNGHPGEVRHGQQWRVNSDTRLHSIQDDGTVRYTKVLKVLHSGVKPCIKVIAEDGSWLICTPDHPFLTAGMVYVKAADLTNVEVIALGSMRPTGKMGKQLHLRQKRLSVYSRHHPYGCLRTVHATKRMKQPKDYQYKQVHKARIVVEAAMNGIGYDEFLDALSNDAARSAAFTYLPPELEVHHRDGNPTNDAITNLQVLSKAAHAALHGTSGNSENFKPDYTKRIRIVGIEWVGLRDTYDITMDPASPNFSANRFFVHNTWKTTWSAQWPKPLFLSIAAEGGDDALKVYPSIASMLCDKSQMKECPPVFNRERPPIFHIKSAKEMADKIEEVCLHHKAWGISTVVVDSLTYLVDLWIDDFVQHAEKTNSGWRKRVEKQGGDLLGPPEWGFLNMFLRSMRVKLNNEGLNAIWTCLQNDVTRPSANNMAEPELEKSVPLLQGKNRITLPGMCKLHLNATRTKVPHPTALGRMMIQPTFWTASDSYTDLRHKYYDKFPHGCLMDPEFGTLPTFRAVWAELHQFIKV